MVMPRSAPTAARGQRAVMRNWTAEARADVRHREPIGSKLRGWTPTPSSNDLATTQFHLVSFEGPDGYSRAGGIATRMAGLAQALAEFGFETHLWFVGDPELPGHESSGDFHLHRWCQWISRHHPGGVYDGQEGKQNDFAASLPPYLMQEILRSHLGEGGRAVILAEEWHTANAVLHLDFLLRRERLRERASILWNANNVFGFERMDWTRLAKAAVVTTVSRYMKHLMWGVGIDPIVVPNGLSPDAFLPPDRAGVAAMQRRLRGRTVVAKVARFDPDKRWLGTAEIVRELKRQGHRPLLIARGGGEAHGHQVLGFARRLGLRVVDASGGTPDVGGFLARLENTEHADILNLKVPVDAESRRVLFRGADAVLANSGREPFGLVGLETMAAGGIACTGISGEEYAVPGRNALVLQTSDPHEFVGLFQRLAASPSATEAMRRAGRSTAKQYAWPEVIQRVFLPRLQLLRRAE